jgi:hypothetical protein
MSMSLLISVLWAIVILLAYFQFWPIVQKQKLSPLTACLLIASLAFHIQANTLHSVTYGGNV